MATSDTDVVFKRLQDLRKASDDELDGALWNNREYGGDRNRWAVEAATEYNRRLNSLVRRASGFAEAPAGAPDKPPQDDTTNKPKKLNLWAIIDELVELRNYAEEEERKNRRIDLSWHSIVYARDIHIASATRVRNAIQMMLDLKIEPSDEAVVSGLTLLIPIEGQSKGRVTYTYKITEGYQSSHKIGGEAALKIWQQATASGDIVAGKVSGTVGNEFRSKIATANAYKKSESVTRKVRLEINFDKPCYVYQMKTAVPMTHGDPVVLHGGYFISSVAAPQKVMYAVQDIKAPHADILTVN